MGYWLLKTEPDSYSFADLERDQQTRWDGITNPAALKHLRSAALGDRVLIYHTGDERRAVGIAEVVAAPYPDPGNPKVQVIDVAARERLPGPVQLQRLKAERTFVGSPLTTQGRLSFVPLTEAQWTRILALSRED